MNPLATIGTSLGFSLITKWWEKRQADKLPEVPDFSPTQLMQFTRAEGQFRSFSLDTNMVTLAILGSRSVVPQRHPTLESYGQVWRVVPLQPGLRNAQDVVLEAHKNPNLVVVGSHTLALLPIGSTLPMVLVIGPAQVQILAVKEGVATQPNGTKPAGKFALLRPAPVDAHQPATEQPATEVASSAPTASPEVQVGTEPTSPPEPPVAPPVTLDPEVVKTVEAGEKKIRNGAGKKNGAKDEPPIVAEHTVVTEK